jgi:hypothetical protein
MVAQGGKAGFLKAREDVIAIFLKAGVAVCLADVRGTGESAPGTSAERDSARTSVSQTNLILGQTVIGSQMRDLRTVIRWLASRDAIDGKKIALWGDSFAQTNLPGVKVAVPLDGALPAISEPGAEKLVYLTGLYEPVAGVYCRGGITVVANVYLLNTPYLYCPHDAVVPGEFITLGRRALVPQSQSYESGGWVDGHNRLLSNGLPTTVSDATKWLIDMLRAD